MVPGLAMLPDAVRHVLGNPATAIPRYGGLTMLMASIGFPVFLVMVACGLWFCARQRDGPRLTWVPAVHAAFYAATFAEALSTLSAGV